jgi:tetratricopeptide (TPR) repeat protein
MERSLQKETKRTKGRAVRNLQSLATPQKLVAQVSNLLYRGLPVRKLRLCAITLFASFSVIAHDSPEHQIEALNKKIAANGATAESLARRATEWRALGKYDEASHDLQKALLINSNSIPLILECASVELERGNVCLPEAILRYGLMRATTEPERAALHMLLAEVAERRGLHEFALADCEKAMAAAEPQLEWHLIRSRLMCRLGRHAQAAATLKAAYEKTPSVVLEVEWIEAMIDAGQNNEALERIAKYSTHGRWRSAWLIRQARAELGLNRTDAAKASLAAALAELEQRINPAKVDATLLADRAMALLLRGERDAAAKDMDRIRGPLKGQVPGSTLARLDRMFWEGK